MGKKQNRANVNFQFEEVFELYKNHKPTTSPYFVEKTWAKIQNIENNNLFDLHWLISIIKRPVSIAFLFLVIIIGVLLGNVIYNSLEKNKNRNTIIVEEQLWSGLSENIWDIFNNKVKFVGKHLGKLIIGNYGKS